MNISKKDNYTFISTSENSFSEFFETLKKENLDNHTIIQLSENLNTTAKDLSVFLDIATNLKSNGISFVIICNNVNIDDVLDEINVVPTLQEAEDILEMEAIERDLGF